MNTLYDGIAEARYEALLNEAEQLRLVRSARRHRRKNGATKRRAIVRRRATAVAAPSEAR